MKDILQRLVDREFDPGRLHVLCWDAAEEIGRLRNAIKETLDENGHLADGDDCTLIKLKMAIGEE